MTAQVTPTAQAAPTAGESPVVVRVTVRLGSAVMYMSTRQLQTCVHLIT